LRYAARSAAVFLLLAGCVRFPGPLSGMGRPVPAEPSAVGSSHPLPPPHAPGELTAFQRSMVRSAAYYLEHDPPGRDDCSSFVTAIITRAGRPTEGSVESLYDDLAAGRGLHRRKVPLPGDLVFFDHTYDRNRNGRLDDRLSHIAVVMSVDAEGTVVMAQGGTSKGRTTLSMNLKQPDVVTDARGEVINEWLRMEKDSDPPGTKYLASQLWRAFGTIDPQ
jgi:peptidoglycan DL-endopeptidase CwlO